ncbi:acyl carrier protein [Actinomycetospora sp. OC33-EN08]|uniref:Acyl carrier protein n=1 Tax=Actinomycetospora aurantiaca TaxID=3129233 RepID=A0ABU8MGG6_9PSEU
MTESPGRTTYGGPVMSTSEADGLVARVREMVERELGIDVESPDTDLVENGLVDSLALVTLMVALEAEFGVVLDLDEFDPEDFRTIAAMASYARQQNSPSSLVT